MLPTCLAVGPQPLRLLRLSALGRRLRSPPPPLPVRGGAAGPGPRSAAPPGARRGFAAAAAAGGGGMSTTHAPTNVLKAGQDPELKPDAEYPDWLWDLTAHKPSMQELERSMGGRTLTREEVRRLWDLHNRDRIKKRNAVTRK